VTGLGTISPWSSKATEIARQCGFDALVRASSAALAFTILDAKAI
jgi:phosphoribosylformylglycinamidine synthase